MTHRTIDPSTTGRGRFAGAAKWPKGLARALALAGLLGAVAATLSACGGSNSSFLHPYGPVAAAQRTLLFQVTAIMMIVVVPVFILLPLFALRYRRRNAAAAYRPEWAFSWPLEIAVWGIPVAIVVVLGYLIWTKQTALDPYNPLASSRPPLEVQVVGLDWKWLFIYPDQGIATVGVVAMPVDRPVHFTLTSATVMQSFFIPSLGSQIYAMGGMRTELNLLADRTGQVEGMNTQFNGMGFQNQKFLAEALPAADFDSWVSTVKQSGKTLDQAAYDVLLRKSTTEVAAAQLGVTTAPSSQIYFSSVPPDFFARVVDENRGAPNAMPTIAEKRANGSQASAVQAPTTGTAAEEPATMTGTTSGQEEPR